MKRSRESSFLSTGIVVLSIIALMFMSGVIGFMMGSRSSQSVGDLGYKLDSSDDKGIVQTDKKPETKVLSAGELKFIPESLEVMEGEEVYLQVQYNGIENINAAKIVLDIPSGFSIIGFDANQEQKLIDLINSPEKAEIHLGRLEEGEIQSGAILLDVVVKAEQCVPSGMINFADTTQVPDIVLSTSGFSFTMDCNKSE